MKSRFCPSPTGYMHLGNLRTALFNALLARKQQGIFLLRIEDTDKSRSTDEYARALEEDLRWLGLDWQEGPGVGGPNGPYLQSQRQAVYDEYYAQLEQRGLVYPCFCTDHQLAITRKVQLASGQPPRYAGTCLNLTPEQIAEKRAQGLKPTLRFRVLKNSNVEFLDLVRGQQRFNTDHIGDFIIRRADGTASFIYCNAIDDALMGVTHALRGEDHLTNTPRQLLVVQALGLSAPLYGHIAMIVGTDGSPLSKRHGSRSIRELRAEGFLPEAIINYLSRLGHYYESNTFMSLDELAARFATETLGASPARFDAEQLYYWQKEAIANVNNNQLWLWMGTEVQDLTPADVQEAFIATIRPNILFPHEALEWAKLFFLKDLVYNDESIQVLQHVTQGLFKAAQVALEEQGMDFKSLIHFLQKDLNIKGKLLYQPLRVALTGRLHGPEMQRVIDLLGKAKVRSRLIQADKVVSG